MREGRFYPDFGLERIVAYHERQDARFAEAADDLITRTGKPILVATELALADPDNAGPATLRARGRLCYPSGERAARALGHLVRDAAFRRSTTIVNAPIRRGAPRRRRGGPGPFIVLALLARRAGDRAVRDAPLGRRADQDESTPAPEPPAATAPATGAHVADVHDAADVDRGVAGAVDRRRSAPRSTGSCPCLNDRSCVAVSVDGEPVASRNADLPVIPASTQKLLVAAVALEQLGEDYQFTTTRHDRRAPRPAASIGGRSLPRRRWRSGAVSPTGTRRRTWSATRSRRRPASRRSPTRW